MLWTLVVVGAVTGANIWLSPQREVPDPTPEYERYWDYGFSFMHQEGMNFTSVGPEGGNATDNEGCLFGVLEGELQLSEEIIVAWKLHGPDPSLEEALDNAFNVTGLDEASLTRSPYFTYLEGDHELLYEQYNVTDHYIGELLGFVGVWYCNYTKRMFTVHLFSPSGSMSLNDLQACYQELMDSFICHFSRPSTRSSIWGFLDVSDLATISSMVFLCIGFTFTYMMDGFLNLSHTTYASLGGLVNFYLVRFWAFDSYDTWPFAALVGGFLGMFLYVALVRPIGRHASGWNCSIALTFTFYVVAHLLGSVINVFRYWLLYGLDAATMESVLRMSNFSWYGYPGRVFLGTVYCILFVVGLHLFLKKTRFGVALRATAEDEDLAAILGIDTFNVHLASWFISGALSALAGAMFSLGRGRGMGESDAYLVSVMTGSIVGGLNSVYGAIFGGIFVTMAQKTISNLLVHLFGIQINWWIGLLPIIFLYMVLNATPNGIAGIKGDRFGLADGLRVQLKKTISNVTNLLKAAKRPRESVQ